MHPHKEKESGGFDGSEVAPSADGMAQQSQTARQVRFSYIFQYTYTPQECVSSQKKELGALGETTTGRSHVVQIRLNKAKQ